MKTITLLFFLFSGCALAQNPTQIRTTPNDPTGLACNSSSLELQTPVGSLYSCKNGVYALVAGTGTGTVVSVATNNGLTGGAITTSGTIGLASVANNSVLCNNSGGAAVPTAANCTKTGTGAAVLATSPTLVTPALGTPTALTLTNATGLPVSGLTGLGTGVGTALGIAVSGSGAICLATGSACGGSSGIVVGSTTITSGTSQRIEFNNAGVVGELAVPAVCTAGQFSAGLTISAGVLSSNCGTPAGGGNVSTSGSPTTNAIPKFASSTTIGNSALDDGATTANTLTYTGSAGIKAPSFTGTGTDAFINLPSNTTHTPATGDFWNNAGTLFFGSGSAPVAFGPTSTTSGHFATWNAANGGLLADHTIGTSDLPGTGATTVNGQTCTLGSTCTIPIQTTGSGNTSQAGVNFITSTVNSIGLTVTPSNPGTNQEKFEITGTLLNRAWAGCTGPGLGDGLNAVPAGTYLQSNCYNNTGATVTITGIKCYSDNNGTTTGNVTNGAGTALLTGAITATNSWAAGTQSGTTTLANDDYIKFTWVADGTSKQFACEVKGTY